MTQMKWYHLLGREMVCWIFGHKWKGSWRVRDKFAAAQLHAAAIDIDIPLSYSDRQSGNPYYQFSAGWHYKCKRCRTSTKDEAWHPFYVHLWWAFKASLSHIKWDWKNYRDYTKGTWKDFFVTLLNNLWGVLESFVLYYLIDTKDVPEMLYNCVFDVEDYLMGRLSENESGK